MFVSNENETGVLLDGPVPRDDDGRHPGLGGGDQEGVGRGEGQGGDQGDRGPWVGDRQHLFSSVDHPDLDQRIQSTDKHQEDPWKRRVVLPKQSTFKETVVRQGDELFKQPWKKPKKLSPWNNPTEFLCFANKRTRVAKLCLEFETCCKGGEKCKQAEGWLNNCNSLLLLLRWKHRKSTAFGKEGKWVLRKETHRDSVIVSGLLWSLCSIQPNHLL